MVFSGNGGVWENFLEQRTVSRCEHRVYLPVRPSDVRSGALRALCRRVSRCGERFALGVSSQIPRSGEGGKTFLGYKELHFFTADLLPVAFSAALRLCLLEQVQAVTMA